MKLLAAKDTSAALGRYRVVKARRLGASVSANRDWPISDGRYRMV